MKHILYFVMVAAALMFVACDEREVTPDTPDTPQEEPQPEPEPDPQPEPKPYPEGTYHFSEGVQGSIYTMEGGLRNDYLRSTTTLRDIRYLSTFTATHLTHTLLRATICWVTARR